MSVKAENRLPVFCQDREVGVLEKENQFTDRGVLTEYRFSYLPGVDENDFVSLLLPVGEDPHRLLSLPPSFQISLPEGWAYKILFDAYRKTLDLSDPFSLLQVAGRNLIGRVTFGGERADQEPHQNSFLRIPSVLGEEGWLRELLQQVSPGQLGVSGAMPKVLVQRGDKPGPFLFDQAILKLETYENYGISLAEEFALRCSANAGIPTVVAQRTQAGDALLVDRFDVRMGERLGFEDMAALSGFAPDYKYNGSVQLLFEKIAAFVQEEFIEQDKQDLLKRLLLNDILRNGDAHLKNFGLLYSTMDDVRLAPNYDVLDTTIFLSTDFPALVLRDGIPLRDQAKHKQWLTKETLPELWEVGELDGVGERETLYRNLQEIVWETANQYAQEVQQDEELDEDRKIFVRKMVQRLGERLRKESIFPMQIQVSGCQTADTEAHTKRPGQGMLW